MREWGFTEFKTSKHHHPKVNLSVSVYLYLSPYLFIPISISISLCTCCATLARDAAAFASRCRAAECAIALFAPPPRVDDDADDGAEPRGRPLDRMPTAETCCEGGGGGCSYADDDGIGMEDPESARDRAPGVIASRVHVGSSYF